MERELRGLTEAQVAMAEVQTKRLASELADVLLERGLRETLAPLPAGDREVSADAARATAEVARGLPGVRCLDDFARYLLSDDTRRAVRQKFFDVVLPLLNEGRSIDIVSHSWGTVVAYEALRIMDGAELRGKVRNFFTVGAALSISTVKWRLQVSDLRKPKHVQTWINLDARGDLVGGPLQPLGYKVDHEYSNLKPVGCEPGFLGYIDPSCAHSSYFAASNFVANRNVFARHIAGLEPAPVREESRSRVVGAVGAAGPTRAVGGGMAVCPTCKRAW
jgi:hypothetical protein